MSRSLLFAGFTVAAAASLFAAVLLGSLPIPPLQALDSIIRPVPGLAHDVIWQLRMPRALTAFACGGLLAAAGVLLQVLLRNALADPYILGVSGGASLGALLALTIGAGALLTNAMAFTGALATIIIVFGLGFRGGDRNVYRLLLTGVVMATGLAALVSLILVMAPQAQVKGMLYWLMGDLAYAGSPAAAGVVLVAVALFGIAQATKLDLLALGRLKAGSLGVAVLRLQAGVFFAAALATVAAVMLGGAIGFVGLMVPHAIRLLGVAEHRVLLPLAILLGGSFLTLADTAARALLAPQQLPVGVLTALIGVPAMLILLGRRR